MGGLLAQQRGVWALVQTPRELASDPQVIANDYIGSVDREERPRLSVAMVPIQFGGTTPRPKAAPELGADTDRVLLELGYDWDELVQMKVDGAIT